MRVNERYWKYMIDGRVGGERVKASSATTSRLKSECEGMTEKTVIDNDQMRRP